jgi:hypothetical protein
MRICHQICAILTQITDIFAEKDYHNIVFQENREFVSRKLGKNAKDKYHNIGPWRRGIAVIASAYRTEDPGFESSQSVRFLGLYTLQCCCLNYTYLSKILKLNLKN